MDIVGALFVVIGTLLGVLFMLMPIQAIWALLIMSMVVSGPVYYFLPGLGQIQWVAALISIALLGRAIITGLTHRERRKGQLPPFLLVFVMFVLSVTVTTLINRQFGETLVTSKNFFQFWSIPLAFYLLIKEEATPRRIMKAILVIAIIQPPIALVQSIFFAGTLPGDSVTGTFGGQIMGGGPNVALAIFLTAQLGIVLSMAIKKVMPWRYAALLSAWFVFPILLTNAKAIVVFYFVMILILFGKYFLRRPLVSLISAATVTALAVAIFSYHYSQAWQYSYSHKRRTIPEYIEKVISGNLGSRVFLEKDRLNRLSAVTFWWDEHVQRHSKAEMFFGHGLGAARHAGIVSGHMTTKPRYRDKEIGLTALSRLLWDVGLVGTFWYVLIFISAFLTSNRLEKDPNLPVLHQAFMSGAQIACIFFVMSLPYKISLLIIQPFNAFSMFTLGYIAFWHWKLKSLEKENDGQIPLDNQQLA